MPSEPAGNLIDTHCHLAHGRLRREVPQVLARARDAGVQAVICATADMHGSKTALSLARRHENVFCTAGIHPHEAKDAGEDYPARIERLARDSRCVAIGETGLDYHYDFSPRPCQQRVFAEQLAVAARIGKPVVVHTREAFDDTLAIVRESDADGSRVLFHSFTGAPDEIRRALDIGATIGFSGIVTFKKAEELRRAAAIVPDDRIVVETDAPYLSPEPVRKLKTNEPANVVHVARCLAQVRNSPPEAFAGQTTANAIRFFGLELC